jgi:hypothetical protein
MRLNQLITFLEVRARGFNYRISAIATKMEKRSERSSLFFTIECERQIQYYQQIVSGILHVLKDIILLRNEDKWIDTADYREKIYQKVLNRYVKKTSDREMVFNSCHPLYGYKPFRDTLLEHYRAKEMYRECSELMRIEEKLFDM